jgi:hypothetical protein
MDAPKVLWPVAVAHAPWGLSGTRSMASFAVLVTPAKRFTSLGAGADRTSSLDAAGDSAPWEAMGIGMATRAVRWKAASLRPAFAARERQCASTH